MDEMGVIQEEHKVSDGARQGGGECEGTEGMRGRITRGLLRGMESGLGGMICLVFPVGGLKWIGWRGDGEIRWWMAMGMLILACTIWGVGIGYVKRAEGLMHRYEQVVYGGYESEAAAKEARRHIDIKGVMRERALRARGDFEIVMKGEQEGKRYQLVGMRAKYATVWDGALWKDVVEKGGRAINGEDVIGVGVLLVSVMLGGFMICGWRARGYERVRTSVWRGMKRLMMMSVWGSWVMLGGAVVNVWLMESVFWGNYGELSARMKAMNVGLAEGMLVMTGLVLLMIVTAVRGMMVESNGWRKEGCMGGSCGWPMVCRGCGYALVSLGGREVCPECGMAMKESFEGEGSERDFEEQGEFGEAMGGGVF